MTEEEFFLMVLTNKFSFTPENAPYLILYLEKYGYLAFTTYIEAQKEYLFSVEKDFIYVDFKGKEYSSLATVGSWYVEEDKIPEYLKSEYEKLKIGKT